MNPEGHQIDEEKIKELEAVVEEVYGVDPSKLSWMVSESVGQDSWLESREFHTGNIRSLISKYDLLTQQIQKTEEVLDYIEGLQSFMPHMQLVLEVPRVDDKISRRCFLNLDTKSENYKAIVENLKKQIIQYNTQRDFIWKKLQAFGQHLKEVE